METGLSKAGAHPVLDKSKRNAKKMTKGIRLFIRSTPVIVFVV